MKTVGIITIHKIHNYGSVLQAYALQRVCEELGFNVEIVDYNFPNGFHKENKYMMQGDSQPNEPKWIKMLFAKELIRQHKGIGTFVKKYQHLSDKSYSSPDELKTAAPIYDVYITGSDQLWNPRYCNGDPAFMLHFAPDNAIKLSYAASIGANAIPEELIPRYKELLNRYEHISVRENSGRQVVKNIIGKDAEVVLDPSLLLNKDEWNQIAAPSRQFKKKYILCYFLNYTFNSFPYVDRLADYMQKQTGFEIVRVSRPPHKLLRPHTHYRVGATPEEFLALVRDAEIVLTTSFHGTAFAVNYGKPIFSIVKDLNDSDSRQLNLMKGLGLEKSVITINDCFPNVACSYYDINIEQTLLEKLRHKSLRYLTNALNNDTGD